MSGFQSRFVEEYDTEVYYENAGGTETTYVCYAPPGTNVDFPQWAIKKSVKTTLNGVSKTITRWARTQNSTARSIEFAFRATQYNSYF